MTSLPVRLFKPAVLATQRFASLGVGLARMKPGLRIKLLFLVTAIALIGIITSSFLLLSSLRQQFITHMEADTVKTNLLLQGSLEHAMLSHDPDVLAAALQRAVNNINGERIRILDFQGVVRSSSLPSENGRQVARDDPECQACHSGGSSQARLSSAIARSDLTGEQVLVSVIPITNQPDCTGCHPAKVKTLGLLLTEVPLTGLNRQVQDGFWLVALAALLSFALLVGLLMPALRKVILKPISELSKGVMEIRADNLDYQVRVDSQDELGQLADAFDGMRAQLKTSRAAMIDHSQEIGVLYEVARITGQLLDLEQILNQALGTVVKQLDLEVGLIYLKDQVNNHFEPVASRGLSREQLQLIAQKRSKPGGDLTQEVALSGEVFFVPDVSQNHHFVGMWKNPNRRSYINLPLKSQGKVVGTLEMVSHAEKPLTGRLVEVLTVVGNQIGIAIDNTSLLTETQRNAREALTLYQLGTQVSSSLELNQVLEAVAQGAREALAGDIGAVCLLDLEHNELVVRAISGALSADWLGRRIPITQAERLKAKKPICWLEPSSHLPAPVREMVKTAQITSMLFVPLMRSEKLQGGVTVLTRARHAFSEEEIHLLTRLAQQVVVAIENARLYQQVRYMAVLEERDRLAREMHDDLAQALGFLNLKASITSDLMSSGDTEQAQASLQEMKQITREAYTDTREAIFNLRNTASLGANLMPMLSEYLAEYRAHYGLDAQLVVEDASMLEFPTEVALQLNRIIQEGLTNIRKHAQASCVWLRFEREGSLARIVIEDNGRGFDPSQAQADGKEHFGLQIMRERAESVGGTVELAPEIGRGTRVVIRVPVQPNGEVENG